ncbi:YaeQ family protein [Ferrimonas balearica DSM 9799]|uniref:YaeQ family protein n=1 Tax=Ferrimonas balearica (strain DSM 9799 / CCM 4581 / KCTC 23876 / PAT) TaxID=550540 RepID=E1STE1_FERBD|nr:YaeQ family protein [Ferrimonas balearica]ADN77175.1 YaeQ family protein [Ferrimonas balearica DSM 9799]MBW3139831.1 YaeQ family protein [Ferrimonas balearica]MBW3164853.1 YaeQ family protein [Ferrimonas balearica]MBY5980280.1 YaeQ family protein [Ferrimonas balearica]MBY6107063.1 YaeQ family protein [Ferrimonas balearica]
MALKATVFKARVQLSDMDRHVYLENNLTLARHPSETDLRMMLRLLAWGMYGNERLEFTRGLCADDEPELWQKSYSDEIELWIDLGMPEETRIRKACNRAQQVVLLAYGDRAVPVWWEKNKGKFSRFDNLTVWFIGAEEGEALAAMVERTMDLAITISDGEISVSGGEHYVTLTPQRFK